MRSRLVPAAVLAAVLAPATASAAVADTTPIGIAMAPASPRAGSEVRLTGGAGAPSYAWDLDGDGQFDDATGIDVTATFGPGTRKVSARAVTAVGVLTDSRTFTVHEWNVAPSGTVHSEPYSARVGAPVTIGATGSDPDGPSVHTSLDLDGDGTFETAGAAGTASFPTPGERVIRARFTDDAGATAVATTTLDVHAGNFAPTARLEGLSGSIGSSAAAAAEPFSGWTVLGFDPDGRVVRYEFDLDGDGSFETDGGADNRIPKRAFENKVINVRVTDDSGATQVERAARVGWLPIPPVAQVGVPVKPPGPPYVTVDGWDADGDGQFDDGTGKEITFTYPSVGTYAVRVRGGGFWGGQEWVESISVREAADVAVPRAGWWSPRPARPTAATFLSYAASGPMGAEASLDLDGDGAFNDGPGDRGSLHWTFGGPATIALKATDAVGRSAVATTQIPFVGGDLGPDAMMRVYDHFASPLQSGYRLEHLEADASDADDGSEARPAVAWDGDGDGVYDVDPDQIGRDSPPTSSVGLRVTDTAGVSTTLRRAVTPLAAVPPPTRPIPPALRIAVRRPHLATLLRRGLTVDVRCTLPKCRTRLTARIDAKTAKRLRLRSRVVASRSVTGTRRVRVTLTPKARRALAHVRSVKLTLTATASAASAQTVTLTIRRR